METLTRHEELFDSASLEVKIALLTELCLIVFSDKINVNMIPVINNLSVQVFNSVGKLFKQFDKNIPGKLHQILHYGELLEVFGSLSGGDMILSSQFVNNFYGRLAVLGFEDDWNYLFDAKIGEVLVHDKLLANYSKASPVSNYRRNYLYRIDSTEFVKIIDFYKHNSEDSYLLSGYIYCVNEFDKNNNASVASYDNELKYISNQAVEHKPFYEYSKNNQLYLIESIMQIKVSF